MGFSERIKISSRIIAPCPGYRQTPLGNASSLHQVTSATSSGRRMRGSVEAGTSHQNRWKPLLKTMANLPACAARPVSSKTSRSAPHRGDSDAATLPPGSAHSPDQSLTSSAPRASHIKQPALGAEPESSGEEQGGGASPQAANSIKRSSTPLRLIHPIHGVVTHRNAQLIQQCIAWMNLPGATQSHCNGSLWLHVFHHYGALPAHC